MVEASGPFDDWGGWELAISHRAGDLGGQLSFRGGVKLDDEVGPGRSSGKEGDGAAAAL